MSKIHVYELMDGQMQQKHKSQTYELIDGQKQEMHKSHTYELEMYRNRAIR